MTLRADFRLRRGSLDLRMDMTAEPGQVTAVLGPNGSGKTTFLRALAGLEAIESGRIEAGGRRLDDPDAGVFIPPSDRSVGLMFQDGLLFPHLSVVDNVAFPLRARHHQGAQAEVVRWIDRLGLKDLTRARPAQLSGGQAQRVALARALAGSPELLLLDEPMASLDASAQLEIRRELAVHLATFSGVAILVTHDPLEAAVLADRVVVLEGGRIIQEGTLEEITARPRSRYVADLAGLNLWRANASGMQAAVGDAVISLGDAGEGQVFVLVHPRSVALYRARPDGSPRNCWQAVVISLEGLGDRVRVEVEGPLKVVAEVTLGSVVALGLRPGEHVWASFKASEVEVYPV